MLDKILAKFKRKSYTDPVKNSDCSELEVDKWILSEFIVNKLVPIVGMHPYPLDELLLLTATVCSFRPTHIFEWGTHIGKSARIFYETSKQFSINAEVHSFDLPDNIDHVEHPHGERGYLVKGIKEVFLYQEDGLKKGIEIYEQSNLPNKRALFYVDGDHEYETVLMELSTILQKIDAPIVLLHDTFYQSGRSRYNVGPNRAMQDTLTNYPGFTVVSTILGLPGMSLVYKKNQ